RLPPGQSRRTIGGSVGGPILFHPCDSAAAVDYARTRFPNFAATWHRGRRKPKSTAGTRHSGSDRGTQNHSPVLDSTRHFSQDPLGGLVELVLAAILSSSCLALRSSLGRPIFFLGTGFLPVRSVVTLAGLFTTWFFGGRLDSVFGEFAIFS